MTRGRWWSRRTLGAAAVGIALLGLAACGSDDDDSSSAAGDTTTTAAASAPDETTGGGGGAGADLDELIAAANEEGTVHVYSSGPVDSGEALIEAFEAKYPDITVELERLGDADFEPRLDTELRTGSGVGDVRLAASSQWLLDHEADLLPLETPNLDDPAWADYVVGDGDPVAASVIFNPYGVAWNTNNVSEPLTSWEDVLNPDFQGRIGIIDPTITDVHAMFQFLMGQELGEDWLRGLLEQQPRLYTTTQPMLQALIAGEIDIAVPMGPTVLADIADGAPLQIEFPEPTISPVIKAAIPRTAPHPNAAQLLVDFITSPEGQEAVNQDKYSVLADIPGTLGSAADLGGVLDTAEFDPADKQAYLDLFNEIVH